ncbi:MAG TPA: substrate-binding domain-containing protein [Vicinamibacteria bacterium]
MKRNHRRSSALFVAFLLEVSCGGDRGVGDMTGPSTAAAPVAAPAAPASKPKHRFVVIPKARDLPVFAPAKAGAERMAATLGNIEILWRGPETTDPARQKEVLESSITEKVDGIAISCVNGDFLTETIDKAVAAGIPVVTWDSDAPKSKRQAFYGIDDGAAGKALGEETARLLGGKGKVALITSLGADNLRRRLEGVQEALKGHPGINVVEVFDVKDDPARSAEIIAAETRKHTDLGAWISVAGFSAITPAALEPLDPARTRFAGFDTVAPGLEAMKAGKVQVLIGQKYFGWGSEAVKILAGIKGGKPPAAPIVDSGFDVVTPASLEAYQEAWAQLEKPSAAVP